MLSDPQTLYKLMILHMLTRVNFPLTNSQLSDFFLTRGYTNYFTLQQVLSELESAGLIRSESVHNSTRYEITREGTEAHAFFGNKISPEIISDINEFFNENKLRMREEVDVTADFYPVNGQEYNVHCEVREGKSLVLGLDISVPDEEQAAVMTDNWKEKSQEIYADIMRILMGSHYTS